VEVKEEKEERMMGKESQIGRAVLRASVLVALGVVTQGCAVFVGDRGETTDPVPPPSRRIVFDAAQVDRYLTLAVDVKAKGDASETVAGDIGNSVEDTLTGQFKITGDKPDVTVSLSVAAEQYASFGEYKMYKGDVDVAARRTHDGNLLGKRKFSKEGERGLGHTEALKSLARVFDEPITRWLTQTVTPAKAGLKATDVTVGWTRFQDLFGLGVRRAEYARTFVAEVSKLKGVAYCELVSEDLDKREQTFRVVCYPEEFRAGLLNTLAGIEKLNIER